VVTLLVVALVTAWAMLTASWVARAWRVVVPTQFVAKVFTEALGRGPDPAEWERALDTLSDGGCSAARLARWGESILSGREYARLPYDSSARLLTLYRTILNREPDAPGWQHWLGEMRAGAPAAVVADALYHTTEFLTLATTTLCNPEAPHFPNYHFGTWTDPVDMGADGPGLRTERELQAALSPGGSPAPPGTVVTLASEATISLSQTLQVPAGVTLTTAGAPPRTAYAALARLVRDRPDDQYGPVVLLEPGAALAHVWVDGHGDDPSVHPPAPGSAGSDVDVDTRPGAEGTTVVASRLDNASAGGFTTLHLSPSSASGPRCGLDRPSLVADDLVTDYSSDHDSGHWKDGISIGCEESRVEGNDVVDASDVGIIAYRPVVGSQSSRVAGNHVLAAGNSAFAGLATDPLNLDSASSESSCRAESFAGTWFHDNTLWTGPSTRFDLALSVGTRAFHFLGYPSTDPTVRTAQWCSGVGARFTDNASGRATAWVTEAVSVSGMLDAETARNFDPERVALVADPAAGDGCPPLFSVASVEEGTASGDLQPYLDAALSGCEGGETGDDAPELPWRDRHHDDRDRDRGG
jgi:Domain of unknown function (DUF4214)